MNNAIRIRAAGLLLLCAIAAALCGCASTAMKGTPFYTGEYHVRRGPVEDRVNVWPLLYYREPALSVLWPFIEKTEDHFALRPLFSVYGLHEEQHVYNVLWPLGQFDRQSGNNRVFPVFWGKDYRVVFPLYWHFGHPFGGERGYDGLIPLWSYARDERGYSAYFPWPFVHVKDREGEKGWHVWPLAGSYRGTNDLYRFGAWPLFHQWSADGGKQKAHALLPVYVRATDEQSALFLSLPWSQRRNADGTGWKMAFPLFFAKREQDGRLLATLLGGFRREGDHTGWFALPVLSWGSRNADECDTWLLAGLAHRKRDDEGVAHHVFPFYYKSERPDGSLFLSVPWSCGKTADGGAWQFVPLLFYRAQKGESRKLITPLYAAGESDGGQRAWHAVIPLWYRSRSGKGNTLATLLGGMRWDADGRRWLIYPLLSGGRKDADGGEFWIVAPLVHAEWTAESASHHVLPLYYWNGETRTFLSLVAARWQGEAGKTTTLVPLVLSWLRADEANNDLWLLGGLGRVAWGEKPGRQHLIPLFYRNAESGTFLSPVMATWDDTGTKRWLCPPLLSLYSTDGTEKSLWALLGLAHRQWGRPADSRSHILPFYMHKQNAYLYTPLFGWNTDPEKGFVYPCTPLFGIRRGKWSGSWLFPLYSHTRFEDSDDQRTLFLWGEYWKREGTSGSHLFPFYRYRNAGAPAAPDAEAYQTVYGKDFFCLPVCWYKNQQVVTRRVSGEKEDQHVTVTREAVRKHGCFPLWRYSRRADRERKYEDVKGSVLFFLYDYLRRIRPSDAEGEGPDDYRRARVLWRVWHYERSNGDVSLDVFPAITYDRKQDGFKKVSFLWRFFRYERGKDGTKLDVLFIPVKRGK
ncbi:MAG: hypothetical protein JXR37_20955 [Kiritimatiellae bacterium]|nr:hypothetical protein [Kiritimatiellia bacterium]